MIVWLFNSVIGIIFVYEVNKVYWNDVRKHSVIKFF